MNKIGRRGFLGLLLGAPLALNAKFQEAVVKPIQDIYYGGRYRRGKLHNIWYQGYDPDLVKNIVADKEYMADLNAPVTKVSYLEERKYLNQKMLKEIDKEVLAYDIINAPEKIEALEDRIECYNKYKYSKPDFPEYENFMNSCIDICQKEIDYLRKISNG